MGEPLEMPEPEMMDTMGRDRRYSTLPVIYRNPQGRFSTGSLGAFSTYSGMTIKVPPAVVITDSSQKEFTSSDVEKQLPNEPVSRYI